MNVDSTRQEKISCIPSLLEHSGWSERKTRGEKNTEEDREKGSKSRSQSSFPTPLLTPRSQPRRREVRDKRKKTKMNTASRYKQPFLHRSPAIFSRDSFTPLLTTTFPGANTLLATHLPPPQSIMHLPGYPSLIYIFTYL